MKLQRIVFCIKVCTTCIVAGPLAAQQFVDETATRFPQPNLLEYTNQVTIGDIDNDNDLDLIFANGGNVNTPGLPEKLRIFINNGSGVFADETDVRTGGLIFLARGAELGDIERDGDLDIIIAQDFNLQPVLLVNNGVGVFTDQTLTRLPIGLFSSSRAQFGDIDNDGDLDLYLTNGGPISRLGAGRGKLWRNNGEGFYTDITLDNTPAQNVGEPFDCIFGDVDGDLDLDLRIGSNASNQSKLYRNNGAGLFTNVSGLPADNNCNSYDFGDVDNDGDLDLLGANGNAASPNSEILLRNSGTGSYTALGWTGSTVVDWDSKFFDFDNDGDLDIVMGATGPTERFYTNNGASPPSFSILNGAITAIADTSLDLKVADLNGDGRYDIVTAQGEAGSFVNRIYMNTGPVDTVAPKIAKVEQVADTDDTAGPYAVRAVIYDAHSSDRGFHAKSVTLHYSVGGSDTQQVAMEWVGNSMWRGKIPGQRVDANVNYFVSATDFANNSSSSASRSFLILHPPCPPDLDGSGQVDVDDLLIVINGWGDTSTTHNISVSDAEFFAPAQLNARSGDTLTWNWVEGFHTVTSGSNCAADNLHFNATISSSSPTVTYVIPHDFAGELPYFCIPHCGLGMVGNVSVSPFAADATGDGVVDTDDLLVVINGWGDCP